MGFSFHFPFRCSFIADNKNMENANVFSVVKNRIVYCMQCTLVHAAIHDQRRAKNQWNCFFVPFFSIMIIYDGKKCFPSNVKSITESKFILSTKSPLYDDQQVKTFLKY